MSAIDPYTAHQRFIAPAAAKPEVSRIFLTLFGFELALMLTPGIMLSFTPSVIAMAYKEDVTPFGTTLGFAAFGLTLVMFHMITKVVHDRGVLTMLGPAPTVLRDFRLTLIAVAGVLFVIEIAPPFIETSELATTRLLAPWVIWAVIAFVPITVQCATEEVVYRGYLQQQLAIRSRSPLIWMGIPSVLFGIGHYFNGWGPADGALWAFWATLLGLACADLTARTGSLGAAIGLHTANNLFAALIISIEDWPSSGLALYLYPYDDPTQYDYSWYVLAEPWALLDVVISATGVLVMWLAARIALRR